MAAFEAISVSGTVNTRDLGGAVGLDGKRVKKGLIYRSDNLCCLTAEGVKNLETLNLKYDVDLRSPDETVEHPEREIPGVEKVFFPVSSKVMKKADVDIPQNIPTAKEFEWLIHRLFALNSSGDGSKGMESLYCHYVVMKENQESYTKFLNFVATADGPFLFHCADGKDRTGMAAAYILSILGVSREDIMKDYMLSAPNQICKVEKRRNDLKATGLYDHYLIENLCLLATVKPNYLQAALDLIDKNYGGMGKYLVDVLHITPEIQFQIRQKYLED